jgi:predicted ArsR family transcriptional regulator
MEPPLDSEGTHKWEALAALASPARRALYLYVAGADHDVSRDEAVEALEVSRSLAAFHLDKLVEAGLLETTYRRLGDRRGPGAGRPAKLYRRSHQALEVSFPERQYELAGEALARALEAGASPSPLEAVEREGRRLGEEAARRFRPAEAGASGTRAAQRRAVEAVLAGLGYEPARHRGQVVLRNCPFHALAERHRELVCAMNRAFVDGVLTGLGTTELTAWPTAEPDRCCVTVRPSQRAPS